MVYIDSFSSGIEQLRTCNRCHQVFPVLSDLFNHICDDEDDNIVQSTLTNSSKKYISDNSFNPNKTTLDHNFVLNKTSLSNQGSSTGRLLVLIPET